MSQKKRKSHRELINHNQLVARIVQNDPDLTALLHSIAEQKSSSETGPKKLDFRDKKHKSIVSLSGYNVVLLKKMVRDEMKADPYTNVTKSVIINRMVEYFLENHKYNANSRKM